MPWSPRISGGLVRCGRCGRRYTNPATHVCVTRLDRKRRPGRARVRPKLSVALVTCGACGKPYGNPLTHTCATKTDWKKRQAAAARRAAHPARTKHDYRECADEDCSAYPCRVYREGYERGYGDGNAAGYGAGYAAGQAEGYDAGFSDGAASAQAG